MNKQLCKYEGLVKTILQWAIKDNASSLCTPPLANIHKILCTELSISELSFVKQHNMASGSDCAGNRDWEAAKQKCSIGMCCTVSVHIVLHGCSGLKEDVTIDTFLCLSFAFGCIFLSYSISHRAQMKAHEGSALADQHVLILQSYRCIPGSNFVGPGTTFLSRNFILTIS